MGFSIDFGIIVLAALIHASLQLSVGCLLLLHRQGLMAKLLHKNSKDLAGSFVSGVGLLIMLAIMATGFVILNLSGHSLPAGFWCVLIGMLAGLALATWLLYYKKAGTTLWIPRTFSDFLAKRIKKTDSTTEAFGLGMVSVVGEAPFAFVLVLVAASAMVSLDSTWQLLAVGVYTLIAISPLVVTCLAIKKQGSVSGIQKWRMSNKTFLKLIGGCGFLVLAAVLIVFKLMPILGVI
ncbi:hypothetical protein FWF48_01600 [Candidatus Saccharibacteria bacterium]|nr:hypothetical protein [Candidatus Saccharibacteria bacterium]